jgi:hypothetical protein
MAPISRRLLFFGLAATPALGWARTSSAVAPDVRLQVLRASAWVAQMRRSGDHEGECEARRAQLAAEIALKRRLMGGPR